MIADRIGGRLRVDKWLWYARFFKSRSRAANICAGGKVRVNRRVIRKAHHALKVGDVLTFPQGVRIRVIEVAALGARRGPATEARTLYRDLAPAPPGEAREAPVGRRDRGAGRPTKRDRRAIGRLHGAT
jgi:ribosome-associated heat shock protein Hsp15